MRRARVLLLVAVPLVLLGGTAAFVFVRTERGLAGARTAAGERGRVGFEVRRLGGPTRGGGPGFEPVASAAGFSAGAFFEGQLYLTGPAGLHVYGPGGAKGLAGAGTVGLVRTYRVGTDLPAAALGPMAVARLRGESGPVLAIATAGEGVLLFSPGTTAEAAGSFRQIWASAAEMRDVTALLPLATGELLIGTRRAGLLIYSGAGGGGSGAGLGLFRPEIAGVPVTALAEDGEGGVWVGTRDRGAMHCRGGTLDQLGVADGLPDEQVESFALRGGELFVGTPVGVAEVRGGKVVRRLAEGSFAHALAVSGDGKILEVGTLEEGVVEVPLGVGRELRAAGWTGEGQGKSSAVEEWVTEGGDLYAVERDGVRRRGSRGGGVWEKVVEAPGGELTDGNVSALAFAEDGRLWVGYFDHGVDVLDGEMRRAEHVEDDAVFCVNRLMVDERGGRGTMVAATANGLVFFDAAGKERQVLTRKDGLIADHVTDLAMTRKGLAVATPAGLTFVDRDGTASVYGFEGLVNNHVYAIGVQADGDSMLAGTLGGISLLEDEGVRRNLTVGNSGLRHNWVTAVVAMPDGGWMAGTYGAGVMRVDRDGGVTPMEGPEFGGKGRELVVNPNAMLATREHVFAGTLGHGLWVWTRATGRWAQWTRRLPSENVTAMVERDGWVYVGTGNGLVRIAERALDGGGGE